MSVTRMKPELKLFILLLSLLLIAKPAVAGLVSHPVFGNISALCKRQPACIARQEIAMRQSLAYLHKKTDRRQGRAGSTAMRRGPNTGSIGSALTIASAIESFVRLRHRADRVTRSALLNYRSVRAHAARADFPALQQGLPRQAIARDLSAGEVERADQLLT